MFLVTFTSYFPILRSHIFPLKSEKMLHNNEKYKKILKTEDAYISFYAFFNILLKTCALSNEFKNRVL